VEGAAKGLAEVDTPGGVQACRSGDMCYWRMQGGLVAVLCTQGRRELSWGADE